MAATIRRLYHPQTPSKARITHNHTKYFAVMELTVAPSESLVAWSICSFAALP